MQTNDNDSASSEQKPLGNDSPSDNGATPQPSTAQPTAATTTQHPDTFDFILFGATSFVGKILCQYMIAHYAGDDVRWAIAGRSQSKLEGLKLALGESAEALPVLLADANDDSSLQQLCNSTKVVVSTVGPYALYGEPLIKACATTGTDYCDLTGEAHWIGAMIRRYQTQAEHTGARIVNSCGFDSIPSDLGVLHLQNQAKQQYGDYCYRVKMRVKAIKGGFSGGTVASLINVVKEAAGNPSLRRELTNPYALCPENHPFSARQASNNSATFDSDFKKWTAPFVMAAINTRIVHRSHALQDARYGNNFQYDEAVLMTSKSIAKMTSVGLAAFMVGAAVKPFRYVMESFFLPKPGEGPSPKQQQTGFFNMHFYGQTASGQSLRTKVTGDKDPGYGSTAKMLAETAIHFANMQGPKQGGFWTPASLFGTPLIDRLIAKAGLTFEIMSD